MRPRNHSLAVFGVFVAAATFFLLIEFGPSVEAGTLTCSVTSTCNSPGVVILRLASTTNSHAELPTQANYANLVCCTGVTGLGNSCGATLHAVAVNLASTTNSHVEKGTLANYSLQACISVPSGSTTIGYTTTSTCSGFDTTLFSISSSTNAHVAKPGSSTFQPGSTIQVCGTASSSGVIAPTVSSVILNNASSVILTPNATTSVNVSAVIADANGCSSITGGTTTILLYRSGITSSTCIGNASNTSCYVANAFTASSTCSSNSVNTTTTFGVYYFAQATDASSSFSSQNWIATVIFKDSGNATGTGDSTGQELLTLTAINITTTSIAYGTLNASSTTGSTNQTTTIQNAGNSSTTLQLSGTALVKGANLITTSSQHYATSSFTFGGSEQQLSGTPTTVSGFKLTAPTSTTAVQSSIFWGLTVPAGNPTGTYSGTSTFTSIFST